MLAKKLGAREGSSVAVLDAPPSIDLVLPPGVSPSDRGAASIVLVYVRERAVLDKSLPRATKRLAPGGVLWVAYPKAGRLGTDLNRDSLARALQAQGLEPVAQIAVDDTWSALRFKRDPALSAERKVRASSRAKKTTAKKTAPKKTTPKTTTTAKKTTAKKTTRKSRGTSR